MNDLQTARRPASEPGGAGLFEIRWQTPNGDSTPPILPDGARGVKPLAEQAARLEAHHRELATWHQERAARWLEWAHLSPWHASHWREHIDAAAWHERLAARHAQICAALEGAGS